MNHFLIDSCFWIALYSEKGSPKETEEAEAIAELINDQQIIIPFPTLYEFVSSRLSRRETALEFEKQLYRPNVKILPDNDYRDAALENFFIKTKRRYADISLVDEIIKLIIEDKNLKIDYVISFDSEIRNQATASGINTL